MHSETVLPNPRLSPGRHRAEADGMIPGRREVVAGLLALSACSPDVRSARDIFAAGQPAAILLFALAPDRLIGWPRRPSLAATALLPAADLPQTGALGGGGAPASPEAVAALRPRLLVDYGDVDPRRRATIGRVERRLGIPCRLIDGALIRTPDALAQAAGLLNRDGRGRVLADRAEAVLARWRQVPANGPSFYYARAGDGLETGFAGSLATEVLEGAGWRNVAVGDRGIGRVRREQVAAWDPEVIVTLDPAFARSALREPLWARRRDGGGRRLLLVPDLPFGWIDRPPSINRLLGCAWLAGGTEAAVDLSALLWNAPPGPLRAVAPRWLA